MGELAINLCGLYQSACKGHRAGGLDRSSTCPTITHGSVIMEIKSTASRCGSWGQLCPKSQLQLDGHSQISIAR